MQSLARRSRAGVPALNHEQSSLFQPPDAVGPYRVRRTLAVGTLGPVLLVEHTDDGASLALKLILTPSSDDAEALADQLASLLGSRVDHPGLVQVVDAGVSVDGAYLVMPLVDAPALQTRLRGGRQTLAETLDWLAPVAAGLHHAHGQGLFHGSIHPRDVLLGRPHSLLTGVGMSPALEALGLQAPVRVPYTAPERASGRSWDAQADQYSLAMLALDALSGRHLIAGTIPAFDRWTLADTPAEDARLHDVFACALHPDPDERFDSVDAWLDALTGAAGASSDLSRFTRDGVIPAADVRRDIQVESLEDSSAQALSLFPSEDSMDDDLADDSSLHFAPQAAAAGGDHEWLVASLPEEASSRDEVLAADDSGDQDAQDAPVQPEDDDFQLAAPAIASARWPEDTDALSDRAPDDDAADQEWADTPEDGDDGGRRSVVVLAVALLLVAALGYGTWSSLRTDPGGVAPQQEATAPGETAAEPPTAVEIAEEPLKLSPEELTPGADVALDDGTATSTPAPPAVRSPAPAPAPAPKAQPKAATVPAAAAEAPAVVEPPANRGRMLVRASPAANVRVNGRDHGTSPVVLRDLPFGSYVVVISRPGFTTETREIDLLPSRPVGSLTVDLQRSNTESRGPAAASRGAPPVASSGTPATGSLFVVSHPTGARVSVNDQDHGTTPAAVPDVSAGDHYIRRELPGHRARAAATFAQGSR